MNNNRITLEYISTQIQDMKTDIKGDITEIKESVSNIQAHMHAQDLQIQKNTIFRNEHQAWHKEVSTRFWAFVLGLPALIAGLIAHFMKKF